MPQKTEDDRKTFITWLQTFIQISPSFTEVWKSLTMERTLTFNLRLFCGFPKVSSLLWTMIMFSELHLRFEKGKAKGHRPAYMNFPVYTIYAYHCTSRCWSVFVHVCVFVCVCVCSIYVLFKHSGFNLQQWQMVLKSRQRQEAQGSQHGMREEQLSIRRLQRFAGVIRSELCFWNNTNEDSIYMKCLRAKCKSM